MTVVTPTTPLDASSPPDDEPHQIEESETRPQLAKGGTHRLCPRSGTSPKEDTTVHVDRGTSDVFGVVGRQEQGGIGDVDGVARLA